MKAHNFFFYNGIIGAQLQLFDYKYYNCSTVIELAEGQEYLEFNQLPMKTGIGSGNEDNGC